MSELNDLDDIIQGSHQAALVAPVGHRLLGIVSGASGVNAAGKCLHLQIVDDHEVTSIANCDESEGTASGMGPWLGCRSL